MNNLRRAASFVAGFSLLLFSDFAARPAAAGEVPFADPITITSGSNYRDVAFGDFNGDGYLDILASRVGGEVIVAINTNGDGSLWTITSWSFDRPRDVKVADLDGDDDVDAVLSEWDGGEVRWLQNNLNTTGTFTNRFIDGTDRPDGLAIGDYDGDDDLDLAAGMGEGDGQLAWFENNLGGSACATDWCAHDVMTGRVNAVIAADIDHDGDLDLVIQEWPTVNQAFDVVSWWENTAGDASSFTEHQLVEVGTASEGLHAVDLDLDGDLDITGLRDGDWLENVEGDASVWTRYSFSDMLDGFDAAADDFDGDGDIDMLLPRSESGRIHLWENLICSLGETDSDSDDIPDGCDRCDGGDDKVDSDEDGVPDDCDACPGFDDRVDQDDDGIPDDCDDTGTLSVDDVALDEGDSGVTLFQFTVTLTGPVAGGFDVDVSTSDDTATTAAGDYSSASETLSFLGIDGESLSFTVDVNGDTEIESDETFTVSLGAPTNGLAVVADAEGEGTILTDDFIEIAIDDVADAEGDAGSTNFEFIVTLTGDLAGGFTVPISTSDDTATTADGDYSSASGTLTFAGNDGETQTFNVSVNGDTGFESDETFTVSLGAPSSAAVVVADGDGVGTIQNDDPSGFLSVADVSAAEGDSGTTTFEFVATLTGAVSGGFDIDITTSDGTATTADGDYSSASDMLNFAGTDGETQTFSVSVNGDTAFEPDETFTVSLGKPSSTVVEITDADGVGTIQNDDLESTDLSVSITDSEDPINYGGTVIYTTTISNNGPADAENVVLTHAAPTNSTFISTSGCIEDPSGAPTCTIGTISAGSSAIVTLTATADAAFSGTLTYSASVASDAPDSSPGDESDTETTTVDAQASLAIGDVSAAEGDSGTATFEFVATLTGDVSGGFTVAIATSDDTATTADGDYSAASGTLDFTGTDGETQTFSVSVNGDTTFEADEVFKVSLGAPSSIAVEVADADGVGTIQNDDPEPTDLSLTLVDSEDPLHFGGDMVYTATIVNNGPADAENVVLTHAAPSNTTFVSTSGCSEDPSGVPTCTIGTLSAGDSVDVVLTTAVESRFVGTLTYSAAVSGNAPDSSPGDESASETTEVLDFFEDGFESGDTSAWATTSSVEHADESQSSRLTSSSFLF